MEIKFTIMTSIKLTHCSRVELPSGDSKKRKKNEKEDVMLDADMFKLYCSTG